MKIRLVPTLVIINFFLALGAQALPIALPPERITIGPTDIFLPSGFDDNDIAQIVVAGDLGDICVKAGKLEARVEEKAKRIFLRQEALQYVECWCTKISIPFHQVVDLGLLSAGEYEVEVEGAEIKGKLKVAAALSSAPDNHIYAPVEEARVETRADSAFLTLSGTFPSSCMKMREIKVSMPSPNVVEVLPIADLSEGAGCEGRGESFEARVSLPGLAGKTLVHIRALNGRAINKVINLPQ